MSPLPSSCFTFGARLQLTLNRWGRDRRSLTLMERPISVAMLQCGMVGVKATATVLSGSLTWVKGDQIAMITRQRRPLAQRHSLERGGGGTRL